MGDSAPTIIERVAGHGNVCLGERLIKAVRYTVTVHQNYGESQFISGEEIRYPTFQNTKLVVGERIEAGFDEVLTLHLADGRKLDFYAIRGEVAPRGGLYRD
jgi:hypothetical protein